MILFKFDDEQTGVQYEIVADSRRDAERAIFWGGNMRMTEYCTIPHIIIKTTPPKDPKEALGFDPNMVSTP